MAKKNQKAKVKKKTTASISFYSKSWLWGVAIAALGFLLYANTLGHDFALDDFSAIKENYVTKQGVAGIPTIWKEHYRFGYWNSPGELYRPVPLTLFAVEWGLSPDNPSLHHFMNVVLYALTGFLLFGLLHRLLPTYGLVAFLGTAFFMAHPVHTEIVANIKSRDEILAFLFFILSMSWVWKYAQTDKWLYLFGGVIIYALALFSKESAITFLALYPLFLYFFSSRQDGKNQEGTNWKKIGLVTGAMLVPAVIFLLVRNQVLSGFVTGGKVNSVLDNLLAGIDSPIERIATTILLLGKYLWTMIFPHPLGSDFGYSQITATGFGDWRVLLSLIAHVGLLGVAIWGVKRKHFLSFCILFYGITFSIFSNVLLEIGSSFGERFLYIPLLGFTLALAYGLEYFLNAKKKPTKTSLSLIVGGILIGIYGIKTVLRNPAWYDSYTLYATDIVTAPNSAKLNYHYGLESSKRGQKTTNPSEQKRFYTDAKLAFNKAISIYPSYGDAYGQLGLTLFREGNYPEALNNYQKSIEHKPNNALVYSNMGMIYFQSNDLEKAKSVYQKAVSLDPRFVDARRNLGAVFAMQRNFPAAIEQFQEALKYEPNDATLNQYLGSAFRDSGNESAARPFLDKAVRLSSDLKK